MRRTCASIVGMIVAASVGAPQPSLPQVVAGLDSAVVDSTTPPAAPVPAPSVSPFSTVDKRGYMRRHAYSFDHYLQREPGVVLVRRGPIGGDVAFSRYGIGRGRGVLVHNGIVLNDPQNDIAPVVHFPVSRLDLVTGVGGPGRGASAAMAIEGAVYVDDLAAPSDRPRTFIELSKGTNDLRQRRVQFSSAAGAVGVDLSYDELLNDGYAFDATGGKGLNVPGFGSSTSRHYGVQLRGELEGGGAYSFGLREFTSTFNGDLVDEAREQRRDGHLLSASARHGRFGVRLFERGYTSAYPDSYTVSQTTAAYATARLWMRERLSLSLEAGFEDIAATQRVGGAESDPSLSKSVASVEALAALGAQTTMRAYAAGADYSGHVSQWGGGLEVSRAWKAVNAALEARRSFRLPNLGELFLPAHARGGYTVVGNKYLDGEYAWEVGARAGVSWGPLFNEVRWTTIRMKDPIVTRVLGEGDGALIAPVNGYGAMLHAFEERLRLRGSWRRVEFECEAAGVFTDGDRVGFFASAPSAQLHASARVGGNLFEATSALFFGVEYVRCDDRVDFSGTNLPAYEVVNFTIDGRLLDADMYLAFLNAFDESYRTEGNYLMTPRTFVYGIAWTLWE